MLTLIYRRNQGVELYFTTLQCICARTQKAAAVAVNRIWYSDRFAKLAMFLQVFRGVPFLYELKALLDWSVTRTTLTLVDWLKLEDIRASLYNRECDLLMRGIGRVPGEAQPALSKGLLGFGLFLVVLALLWTPLLAFSSTNPTFRIPHVADFAFNASLAHSAPFADGGGGVAAMRMPVFASTASYTVQPWLRSTPGAALPTTLAVYSPAQLQLLCGSDSSDSTWQPAPAVRAAFLHLLQLEASANHAHKPSNVSLEVGFSVLRSFPPPTAYGGPQCEGSVRVRLCRGSVRAVADVMAAGRGWAQLEGWLDGEVLGDGAKPKAGLFAWVWQLKEHKCSVQSSWAVSAGGDRTGVRTSELDSWPKFEVRLRCPVFVMQCPVQDRIKCASIAPQLAALADLSPTHVHVPAGGL